LRIPSFPPILPPVMIVLESRAGWGSTLSTEDVLESGMSVRLFLPTIVDCEDRVLITALDRSRDGRILRGRTHLHLRGPFALCTVLNPVLRRAAGGCIVPASAARGGYRQPQQAAANIGTVFSNVLAGRGLRIGRSHTSCRSHDVGGSWTWFPTTGSAGVFHALQEAGMFVD
jgi:hypothetical protein